MPVFFYDHNGKLRVIPDAERNERKGSPGSHNKKDKLPPLPPGTIRARVHKGEYPAPLPKSEQQPKKPDPGPKQPPHKPGLEHPPSGGGKGPKQEPVPELDQLKLLVDTILRNVVSSAQHSAQQPVMLQSGTPRHLPEPKPIPMHSLGNLPKAEYHDRVEGKINLWEKLKSRRPFNDGEMKQLFHAIDLQKYNAQTVQSKQQAEVMQQYAEDKLARNMVDNAERDADGNILLHGVPVRSEDAQYFAKQDIQHFQNTDTHLKPSQIMAQNAESNANTAYEFINNPYRGNRKPLQNTGQNIQHKLFFDGRHLVDSQYIGSKLTREVEYPAISGVPGSTDVRQINRGPIPPGKYYLNTKDISYNPLRAVTNRFLGDWGLYRVPLKPDPTTNTYSRKDFYIHGGDKPGSAGCIDIGHNDAALLAALMKISGIIEVIVRYPDDY